MCQNGTAVQYRLLMGNLDSRFSLQPLNGLIEMQNIFRRSSYDSKTRKDTQTNTKSDS